MPKTTFTRSAVMIAGLVLLLFVFTNVFRGPTSGGYRFLTEFQRQDKDAKGSLAQVSPFIPVVTLYGEDGEKPMKMVLLPGPGLAVPLVRSGPLLRGRTLLRYDMTEDGRVTFSTVFGSTATHHMVPVSAEETAARRKTWQALHDRREVEMRQLVDIPATENGWGSRPGDGSTTLILPTDYVYRRGILESLDVSKDSSMKLQRDGGRPLPDIHQEFRARFDDFTRTDDDILIGPLGDGRYFIQAIREAGYGQWLMTGNASDLEAAVKQVAIIRSLGEDRAPWTIIGKGGDNLQSPVLDRFPTYQEQANTAFTEWLSLMLKPESVVLEEPFMQRILTLDVENDAGARLYSLFSIQLSLSAQDDDTRGEGGAVLAQAAGLPVKLYALPVTGDTQPECLALGRFPLVAAEGGQVLGVTISVQSVSLPDCQMAAQVLSAFAKSGFADRLDLETAARFSDYFAQFDSAQPDDNGLMLLRQGKAGAVIRSTGEPVIPLKDDTLFRFLTDDMLTGTSDAPARPGVTVYDLEGGKIAELDYDALYKTGNPKGVWRDIFQTAKGEKYGLYDLKHGREIAANRYDSFSILPDWDMALARRGNVTEFLRPDGAALIPGGVSEYIFADPMRGIPPEDDFIAVRHVSDGNWRFLTKTEIPVLEGVFTDVRQLPRAIAREFELTTADGSKRYIAVTRNGQVDTIPAPD